MGPFAHLGLTAGVAVAASSIWNFTRHTKSLEDKPGRTRPVSHGFWRPLSIKAGLAVLFGSILSDAIDKPIGHLLFVDYFSNGRIFAHTLLFFALFLFLGVMLWAFTDKTWILLVAFGIFMHLVLDQMWLEPRTLFWPVFGLQFPRDPQAEIITWLMNVLRAIISDPRVFLSEFIGFIVLVWLAIKIWNNRQIKIQQY